MPQNQQQDQHKLLKLIMAFLFTVGGVGMLLYIVLVAPELSDKKFKIVATVTALIIAIGSFLFSGAIEIQGKIQDFKIRSGGAFAIFVLVFWVLINSTAEAKENTKQNNQVITGNGNNQQIIENSTIHGDVNNGNVTKHITNHYTKGLSTDQITAINTMIKELEAHDKLQYPRIIKKYKKQFIEEELSYKIVEKLFGAKEISTLQGAEKSNALIRKISEYIILSKELRSLKAELPDLKVTFEAAETLLKNGEFQQVKNIIDDAKRKISKKNKDYEKAQGRLSALKARAAMLGWDFSAAAEAYRESFYAVKNSDPNQAAFYLWSEADAWYELGEKKGDNQALRLSIDAYDTLIKKYYTKNKSSEKWAMTQNNLGIAYRVLGERESGTENLQKAVAAFKNALSEYTQKRVPLNWAATQNNLGTAYGVLGERESGTENLQKAITAFKNALLERTQKRVPLDWAMTQNNLGNAYLRLGERESGTENLQKAITAFKNALLEWNQKRVPLRRAMTQNNLGSAYMRLGERESGTENLQKAVTAYENALLEWPQKRVPLNWAMTQNNLGLTYKVLGERLNDVQIYQKALDAFKNAQQVIVFESGQKHYAEAFENEIHGLAQKINDLRNNL